MMKNPDSVKPDHELKPRSENPVKKMGNTTPKRRKHKFYNVYEFHRCSDLPGATGDRELSYGVKLVIK